MLWILFPLANEKSFHLQLFVRSRNRENKIIAESISLFAIYIGKMRLKLKIDAEHLTSSRRYELVSLDMKYCLNASSTDTAKRNV